MANEQQSQSSFAILKFAVSVCLVCSLVVSLASVSLRSMQQRNELNEKRLNILRAAGLTDKTSLPAKEINDKFKSVIPVVVDLKTGDLDSSKNPYTYDMYAEAAGVNGIVLKDDPAKIKRQAKDGSAYVIANGDKVERIVLPVQGYGLWSTMYGFAALNLEGDITIEGLTFYQHGETPGLGAEITNPTWQAKWKGVIPYADGRPDISVVKTASRKNEVDAIAGSTLTSKGVEHLMNFWLGDSGYKHFVDKVVAGDITVSQMQEAAQQKGSDS